MEIISVRVGSPSQAPSVDIEKPAQVNAEIKNVTINTDSGSGGGSVKSVNGQTGDVILDATAVGALPNTTEIPAKTSDLTNDSGFITRVVNNLANYYLKSETYSKEELDNKISAIPKFSIEVVGSLPTTGISDTTVYLVTSGNEQNNLYTEYIYVNGVWEYLGKQTVDLTEYVKRTELSAYYTSTEIDLLLTTIRNSIPTKLSQLTEDSSHRVVTDAEKQSWNAKANKSTTLAGYGITDGATKTQFEQLSEEIANYKSYVTPQMFGAKADGVTDDTQAIQNALNASSLVYFPDGTYLVSQMITIPSNASIISDNATILMLGNENTNLMFKITNSENVSVKGLHFETTRTSPDATFGDAENLYSNLIAFYIVGATNVLFEHCIFEHFLTAIKMGLTDTINENIKVIHCNMEDCDTPVLVSYTHELYLRNCYIESPTYIDGLHHHVYGSSECDKHIVENCTFVGGGGIAFHYDTAYEGKLIDGVVHLNNCRFYNVENAIYVADKCTLYGKNILVQSERYYHAGVFRANNGSLFIDGFDVIAPNTALFYGVSSEVVLLNGLAEVSAIHILDNPLEGGNTLIRNCDITISSVGNKHLIPMTRDTSPRIEMIGCTLKSNREAVTYVFNARTTTAFVKMIDCYVVGVKGYNYYLVETNGVEVNDLYFINNILQNCLEKHFNVTTGTFANNYEIGTSGYLTTQSLSNYPTNDEMNKAIDNKFNTIVDGSEVEY